MTGLMNVSETMTMSSREIAELTGKSHKNVIRDIRQMGETLGSDLSRAIESTIYKDANGADRQMYELDKDTTLCLVSGYDAKIRMAIIKRWAELENQGIPKTKIEALRMAADALEMAELAIATKAEIGSRREATAMNIASQQSKRANKLKIELDRSKEYFSVKRMTTIHHGQRFDWRLLKSTGVEMGIAPVDVFDQNYGTVKAYHQSVWREAYALSAV